MKKLIIAIFSILAINCTKANDLNYDAIVAIVNEDVITHSQVLQLANTAFDKNTKISETEYIDILNELINYEIVVQMGRQILPNLSSQLVDSGINNYVSQQKNAKNATQLRKNNPQLYSDIELIIKKQLWQQAFINNVILPIIPVNNQDLKKVLDFHTKLNLHQITIDGNDSRSLNQIKDIRQQIIDNPLQFSSLATKLSDSNSSKSSGNLGFINKTALPKVYQQAIDNLQVEQISPIIEFNNELHLIKYSSITIDISNDQAKDIFRSNNLDLYLYEWIISARNNQHILVFPEKIKLLTESL